MYLHVYINSCFYHQMCDSFTHLPNYGPRAASSTYEGAKVSKHVASQTSNFPRFHGTNVIPSGRFPSTQLTPVGSNRDGMCAVVRALCTISFSAECL